MILLCCLKYDRIAMMLLLFCYFMLLSLSFCSMFLLLLLLVLCCCEILGYLHFGWSCCVVLRKTSEQNERGTE